MNDSFKIHMVIGGKLPQEFSQTLISLINEADLVDEEMRSIFYIPGEIPLEEQGMLQFFGIDEDVNLVPLKDFCNEHNLDYDIYYLFANHLHGPMVICSRNGNEIDTDFPIEPIEEQPMVHREAIRTSLDIFVEEVKHQFTLTEGGEHIMSGEDFNSFLQSVGEFMQAIKKLSTGIPPMATFEVVAPEMEK